MKTYDLLIELLNSWKTEEDIINMLNIHKWTFKRWLSEQKVPDDYFFDFNFLLGWKYPNKNSFKDKDQYFTKPEIAKKLYNIFLNEIQKIGINIEDYIFIEPSAWNWIFYDLFPQNKRIGIDIEIQKWKDFLHTNFLYYKPKENWKYIVFWNPPFWLRWNLALRFINHAVEFADIVAFILPPLFNSDWKWTPKNRIKNYKLLYSEELPKNSFIYPNWKEVSVNTIFQIWTKVNKDKIKEEKKESCDQYIKVYSLSDWWTPSTTRNKKMLDKCDIYLPSTTFQEMKTFNSFQELPHKRWYWIKILKDFNNIKNILKNEIDWEEEAFFSTNHAKNLRVSLIEKALIKKGIKNKS